MQNFRNLDLIISICSLVGRRRKDVRVTRNMEEENQEVMASLFGQDKCKNDCKLSVYKQDGSEMC